jgi:DNA-binding beta-propeller fold protein YncE
MAVGCAREGTPAAGSSPGEDDRVPVFAVDPRWPVVPADWQWDEVIGIAADGQDSIWLTTMARVAEFKPDGTLVQSWPAGGAGTNWTVIHGLFVDHANHVWVGARDEHQVLKFTRDGKFLMAIGRLGEAGDSNDPALLGRPAEMYVDPTTNELFVADGYSNRRVVVFEAATGQYLRHWGAYGRPPIDVPRERRADTDESTPPQFSVVHGITGSRDGLIYVADRQNNRIQVFDRQGNYQRERTLRPGSGAAFSVALSRDPAQRFVYVADGTAHKVWVLRRSDLAILGAFGREGSDPGELGITHNVTVDSNGHVYVAEAIPGRRAQKFVFQVLSPAGDR